MLTFLAREGCLMLSRGCSLFVYLLVLIVWRVKSCNLRDVSIDIDSDRVEWRLCSKTALTNRGIGGRDVSLPLFQDHDSHAKDCFTATAVPGTILTNMLQNGMFDGVSDLFVDRNLELVPDIHNVGRDYYTYYWQTSLNVSSLGLNDTLGCDVRLHIRSLNYRATVFCNGQMIPPEKRIQGESQAVGMFHRWTYLLRSGAIKYPRENKERLLQEDETLTIAILVEPPDYPGKVTGDQGGDHDIAKNAAIQQYTAGWDWIRGTPDRNTGLWDKISLSFADPSVCIQNIQVRTLSNITTLQPQQVLVGVSVSLRHQASISTFPFRDNNLVTITAGVIETLEKSSFQVSLGEMNCEHPIGDHCETTFRLPPIQMSRPSLWWPHNYGEPNLYHMKVVIKSTNLNITHSEQVTRFGVHTFATYVDPITNGRVFLCNGVKMFLQGGNWIGTDQFHRFATSKIRYKKEVVLHKRMGLNLIRVWGGGITERPEFYEAADEAGMLVLQEFWMTGDNNGRWGGSYKNPFNHSVYLSCAKDVILMLRNHASLLLWVGGNELYPVEKSPPRDIAKELVSLLFELDPDRFYIPSSTSNYTNYDSSFALAPRDGPYGFLSPFRFFQRNPGLRFWNGTLAGRLHLGFQPEVGASSTPTYRGIQKFLTGKHLEEFPSRNDSNVPSVFEFHNYLSYTDDFRHDHIYAYGAPANMSEYCFRAQLAQYAQVKGLFEGYQRYMWKYYTAMLFWKTQSPWPSFRGFMYDSWLETTGGYWGVYAATEGGQPLHIQLGNWKRDTSVVIINRSPNAYDSTNFSTSCQWWDVNGTLLVSKTYTVDGSELGPYSVFSLKAHGLKYPETTSLGVAYLRLVLHPENNSSDTCHRTSCSFNDYYMSDPSSDQDFTSLGEWRNDPTRLLNLEVQCNETEESQVLVVQITNSNVEIALQIHVRVDENLEKYFYSNQYFSLLPSETRTVTMSQMFNADTGESFSGAKVELLIDGLNVRPRIHVCEVESVN